MLSRSGPGGFNRITYLHQDGLRSVTMVSNTAGQPLYRASYSAYGRMSRTADPSGIPQTRLGFTGRELSVGSLVQDRARYYDPTLGRFAAQDGYPGDDSMPLSLNQYAYVLNNPASFIDPTGMYCANPAPTPMNGLGVNRVAPAIDVMDWTAPGICYYAGAVAYNVYLDFGGNPYNLDPYGLGWLWAPHINAKTLRYAPNIGYGNKNPLSNVHIGMWTNSDRICFIVDDSKSPGIVHFKICIPKWFFYLVGVVALIILLIYLWPFIAAALGGLIATAPEWAWAAAAA